MLILFREAYLHFFSVRSKAGLGRVQREGVGKGWAQG